MYAGNLDARVGTVCGKLLTMSDGFDFPEKPVVDSTGIYFTPNLRHLDRGSLQPDNGHYRQYEYVFGATAAAALYRREMIEDISLDGEFFDADFFVYREDADVGAVPQELAFDYPARFCGDRLLPDTRTHVVEGVLVFGAELEARGRQTPGHHAAAARGR